MRLKRKWIAVVMAAVLAIGTLAGCGGSPAEPSAPGGQETKAPSGSDETKASGDRELVIFTWDLMFPEELLKDFEEKTGIKIVYSKFDTDEAMLQKLSAAKGGDYDLVIADDYIIENAIAQGLVQKLDTSKLKNYGNINPVFQSQFFDPKNEYTIPHGAGIPLIVYDPEQVDFEIKGYNDLWNESLKGSVALTANSRVIIGMTLQAMGESMNTEDPAVIEKAGEKLKELAPNVRMIQDDNTQNALLNGEASVAYLYTSQVYAALNANPNLKVCVPEEGLGFGVMGAFIPSAAPNSAEAYEFLDYMLDAEVAEQMFEFLGYYGTNKAAEALIPEELRELLVAPEGRTMEMVENVNNEATETYNKVWTEFKAACN